MSEFSNRIAAQRRVLAVVNARRWPKESLNGLSAAAIERWRSVNDVALTAPIIELLRMVASELFFLANKSQEQISDEYIHRSERLKKLATAVECELSKIPPGATQRVPSQHEEHADDP